MKLTADRHVRSIARSHCDSRAAWSIPHLTDYVITSCHYISSAAAAAAAGDDDDDDDDDDGDDDDDDAGGDGS